MRFLGRGDAGEERLRGAAVSGVSWFRWTPARLSAAGQVRSVCLEVVALGVKFESLLVWF